MDIGSQYEVAEALPEVFKASVWQGERPVENRSALDASRVRVFFNSLGPNFKAGLVAAVPDAMAGASAPALPLDLLMAGGHGPEKLNYLIDVYGSTGGTMGNTVMVSVGETINTLDGPEGSASERIKRVLSIVLPGVDSAVLLLAVDPFAQAIDKAAAQLLKPFTK